MQNSFIIQSPVQASPSLGQRHQLLPYGLIPPSPALATFQCVLIIYLSSVHPVPPYGYTKIHLGISDA